VNGLAALELVGRQDAMERLASWVAGLGDGPSSLSITGEAGIGKTTLWWAAVEMARSRGATVLVARPVEAELPLGYAALADLLAAHLPPLVARMPAAQSEALASVLAVGERRAAPTESLVVGRATLTALQLLAEAAPVVLAIDDAQWLDRSSARVLAYVARRLGDARCSLLVVLRDEYPDPLDLGTALDQRATELHLGGLSLGAIAHVLRQRVDSTLSRRKVARIHERAAGNPFHALQLARVTDDDLPETLEAGLRQRLAEAPAAARPVLETLAVRGPLRAIALGGGDALDAAIAAGLVVDDDGTIRFDHPLLAEAAHRRIPPGRRRSLHADAAAAATTDQARARHLALAATGPDEQTAEFLAAVARTERMRGAPEAAAELAAHARRIMPPELADAAARIALEEAGYLFLAADEAGAAALVAGILAGPVRGAVRVAALVQRALTSADAATAVSTLEAAVAEPHEDPILAARTLAQLAWQRGAWLGDVEAALPEAERAVAMAEMTNDDAVLATALTTLALLLSFARGVGAEPRFRRALELQRGTPIEPGDHTPNLAFAHERWWRGHFAEGEALLLADRQRALDHGDEGMLMRLAIFQADLEARRGRWDEAERQIEAGLIDAQDYWRLTALIRRGVLRARRGAPGAIDDANELAGSPAPEDPYFAAAAAHVRGLVELGKGDVASAAHHLAQLPEVTAENPARAAEVAAFIPGAVAALAASGDLARGRAITGLLERRVAILEPWGRAAIDYCHGVLDLAAGDHDGAARHLEAAVAGFEDLGATWDLGQALLGLGMTRRRAGQRSAAAKVLERAASIFTELGAGPALRSTLDELGRARPRPKHDDRLTEAERRVARLAADGRTNREIAAALFTGTTTVEAHLTRIYSKLGLRSRTELARRVSDGALALDGDAPPDAPSNARPG
jgi:DNA-binding CsgD family transcriptional regulator